MQAGVNDEIFASLFCLIWELLGYVPSRKLKKALYLSLSGLLAVCFMLGASFKSVQADSPQLMVFGDSLVAGYGLPAEEGFTRQLKIGLPRKGWR